MCVTIQRPGYQVIDNYPINIELRVIVAPQVPQTPRFGRVGFGTGLTEDWFLDTVWQEQEYELNDGVLHIIGN